MEASASPGLLEEFERYSQELVSAVDRCFADWVARSILVLAEYWDPATSASLEPAARRAGREAAAVILPKLDALLASDPAEQTTNPLAVLREGVPYSTAVLAEHGVPPVERDELAVAHFPEDRYDLTPGAFSDIDPSLQEPGLRWGAAKAAVLLARRRRPASKVVAFVPDLMDRSKLSRLEAEVISVSTVAALSETISSLSRHDVVVVDLARPGVLGALEALRDSRETANTADESTAETPWIVGFCPHVDDDMLAAGARAGCDETLPRSVFFRRVSQGRLR